MEVQLISGNCIKIKSKKVTVIIDPSSTIQKTDADAVVSLEKDFDTKKVNGYRVVVTGPGEYEVAGLKISGVKANGDLVFVLSSDNTNAIVAKASSLKTSLSEKLDEYKIAIINADADLNESVVTAMEPRAVVLYGLKAKEGAKTLGKENSSFSSKISLSEDKLPEEMVVMLLG